LFGAEYAAAYVPLAILTVGQLVNAGKGSVASLLNMTGHERDTSRILIMAAGMSLALNFSLTPMLGAIGAAIATAATLITWNVVMVRTVRRRIGIRASPFMKRGQ
jgi:O-antigen/teichoic acid export membrane protein